jgi:hypothetical protein
MKRLPFVLLFSLLLAPLAGFSAATSTAAQETCAVQAQVKEQLVALASSAGIKTYQVAGGPATVASDNFSDLYLFSSSDPKSDKPLASKGPVQMGLLVNRGAGAIKLQVAGSQEIAVAAGEAVALVPPCPPNACGVFCVGDTYACCHIHPEGDPVCVCLPYGVPDSWLCDSGGEGAASCFIQVPPC